MSDAPFVYPTAGKFSVLVRESLELPAADLMRRVDQLRQTTTARLDQTKRAERGQYLTPAPVADLMASLAEAPESGVSILDAGSGVGSLFAAAVVNLCSRNVRPSQIHVTAYEIEPVLLDALAETVDLCRHHCLSVGVGFSADIKPVDFLKDVVENVCGNLFNTSMDPAHTLAILNPPYRKIPADSQERYLLRQLGVETSNLYTGFLAAAIRLLKPEGELVAITPRSFCNGTYFRPFREMFLCEMGLRRVHLFASREEAFREDDVLQETIIVHARKTRRKPDTVVVTTSQSAEDDTFLHYDLPYAEVVHPHDPEMYIRVVSDVLEQRIAARMSEFSCSLEQLGLSVSTGRVVDFRAKTFLRNDCGQGDAPLLYPVNLQEGAIVWPVPTNKPQALAIGAETTSLLIPQGNYVIVKRFSSREEKKRVVAAVLETDTLPGEHVGVENHLNYYHHKGTSIDITLARGLSIFLNSTLVDAFVRQFSGHTQVNASDLRNLRYPSVQQLCRLGARCAVGGVTQHDIDHWMEQFFEMTDETGQDPIATKKRIAEAVELLRQLGLPKKQLNERSGLTLLALLDLRPQDPWANASAPLRGITPAMEFMERHYGKRYAPNTRETVRRQTMHQFQEAGFVVVNPDNPSRPINSGQYVYQIEPSTLDLLRTFGTGDWERRLSSYLASVETLKSRYSQERDMTRIPIEIAPGKRISLSPGGQNVLVERIVHDFAARFTPGGKPLYIGDADEKFVYFDQDALVALGVTVKAHGKMPDVIIHHVAKDWLILVEAVTSHGPVDPKRKSELQQIFQSSAAGLVYVTAFLSRQAMRQYLPEISWETEVWVAEDPTHMIHFNGERSLGPYVGTQ